ncbi:MAG TPA: phosphoribosylanthranilate isomerase [Chloroflexota bacterium]|jgi:phosphoribosylanthranilate isomerase|nr:phosphoribosylanthranilate isomerase [Chloroflexota bacterium]
MQPSVKPRIKVCCISSLAEAQTAVAAGASALGLVSAMPSGPGVIEEALIAKIADGVPPGVATFLLTSLQDVDAIVAQQRRCRASTLQLVDRLPAGSYARLQAALPGIKLVQVIHVGGAESIEEALDVAPQVDGLLLDSGNQSLMVKELGGTGRVHDWQVSRRIRELVEVPVYLAGGLRPDNAAEAIRLVGPFALDVCSGVRTDGRLDPDKLARFFGSLSG